MISKKESYFFLTLPINKQNNRFWNESRPFESIKMPLNNEKILVWCAISIEDIIGPYFFEESVNKDNYLVMLKILFWHRHVQRPNSLNSITTTFNKIVLFRALLILFKIGSMRNFQIVSWTRKSGLLNLLT